MQRHCIKVDLWAISWPLLSKVRDVRFQDILLTMIYEHYVGLVRVLSLCTACYGRVISFKPSLLHCCAVKSNMLQHVMHGRALFDNCYMWIVIVMCSIHTSKRFSKFY